MKFSLPEMGRERGLGFALLALTGLLAALGLWLLWCGFVRYREVANLTKAIDAQAGGRLTESRRFAKDARSWNDSLTAALLAHDPGSTDAVNFLNKLRAEDAAGRRVLDVAKALAALRDGHMPVVEGNEDGAWIQAGLDARNRVRTPPERIAELATLHTVLPMLVQSNRGDAVALHRTLGVAILAMPQHPERPAAEALCRALETRDAATARGFFDMVSDPAHRDKALRLWGALTGNVINDGPAAAPSPIADPTAHTPGERIVRFRAFLATKPSVDNIQRAITAAPANERSRLRLLAAEAANDPDAALIDVRVLGFAAGDTRRRGAVGQFDVLLKDGGPLRLPLTLRMAGHDIPSTRFDRLGFRYTLPVLNDPVPIELRLAGATVARFIP